MWRDRPVYVTGATGLLGSWLVKALLAHRADVVCLVRDWAPGSELVRSGDLERVAVVRGSVTDRALQERVLNEYEIVTVFHLAAQTIVGIANRNPVSTFDANVRGTWSLLEACRRSPTVEEIVVASSDKAYGAHDDLPYTESMPLEARHPYDVSKACADLVARSYATTFETPVVVTRSGNFFGGGDLNWNRIVPGTIRSVLRGEAPVIRSDGTPIRDYIYVEDGVEANLTLAERLANDPELRGEAFNFSYEEPLSVLAMTDRLLGIMESELGPEVRSTASHEISRQFLSAEKARRVLDWTPSFDLDRGLRQTVQWYREFFS